MKFRGSSQRYNQTQQRRKNDNDELLLRHPHQVFRKFSKLVSDHKGFDQTERNKKDEGDTFEDMITMSL